MPDDQKNPNDEAEIEAQIETEIAAGLAADRARRREELAYRARRKLGTLGTIGTFLGISYPLLFASPGPVRCSDRSASSRKCPVRARQFAINRLFFR